MKMMKSFEYYITITPQINIFSFLVVLCIKKRSYKILLTTSFFSACNFESRVDVYRANKLIDQDRLQQYEKLQRSARVEWCPSSQRIKEVWFMIILYDEQVCFHIPTYIVILDTHLKDGILRGFVK